MKKKSLSAKLVIVKPNLLFVFFISKKERWA